MNKFQLPPGVEEIYNISKKLKELESKIDDLKFAAQQGKNVFIWLFLLFVSMKVGEQLWGH